MNLLYVSNEYPPETGFGGIGTYTQHAAEGMARRGHTVRVICRSTEKKDTTTVRGGVAIHRAVPQGYPLPQAPVFFPLRMMCYRAIPQTLVRLAWAKTAYHAFTSIVRAGARFDLIEFPECGGEGYYFVNLFCPAVVRLHTPWEIIRRYDALKEPYFDASLQTGIERRTAKRAAAVSSPSQALADRMTDRWRLSSVAVYPNPLPVHGFAQTAGGNWISVGRVERRKGTHILLKAYARVCAKHSPPQLCLLGRPYGKLPDGTPYGAFIKKLIADLRIDDRILWIEGVPQSSVQNYLTTASVAFFPSLWENSPYACLEAMACGCAPVVSRCGGFPEMVDDGQTGLLVPPDDESALAEAMLRLLNEPKLCSALGGAARLTTFKRYDSSIVCAEAEQFYSSIIRNGRHE